MATAGMIVLGADGKRGLLMDGKVAAADNAGGCVYCCEPCLFYPDAPNTDCVGGGVLCGATPWTCSGISPSFTINVPGDPFRLALTNYISFSFVYQDATHRTMTGTGDALFIAYSPSCGGCAYRYLGGGLDQVTIFISHCGTDGSAGIDTTLKSSGGVVGTFTASMTQEKIGSNWTGDATMTASFSLTINVGSDNSFLGKRVVCLLDRFPRQGILPGLCLTSLPALPWLPGYEWELTFPWSSTSELPPNAEILGVALA